jgi:hypothetical protein
MAYIDVTPMLEDEILQGRVEGCALEQAALKDLEVDQLASYVMAEPHSANDNFMYFMGADQVLVNLHASGGQAAISDGDILSKIQFSWELVAQVLHFTTS